MSMYTTGELAKRCNVSVRTVQYYDERGILIPSELTEGGRRLFSDKDVRTLETICFLKNLGISLKDISSILNSPESKDVITLLLEQQKNNLEKEMALKSKQLDNIKQMQKMLMTFDDASEKSINDISKVMEDRQNLKKMYMKLVIPAVIFEAVEIWSFVIGIEKGNWMPFMILLGGAVIFVMVAFNYWYKNIKYLCPECHTTFKPTKVEAFFAGHTPKTRKLTCPCCQKKVWCMEMKDEEKIEND